MSARSAVVAGVGAARGLGAAVARRFAAHGLHVVALGRNRDKLEAALVEMRAAGASVEGLCGDVTDPATLEEAIARAEASATLDAAIFNAGGNTPRAFLETDARLFENMWRVNAFAGLLFAQHALRRMLPRGRGTLLFTGASASLRGRAGFAGFAAAKAALRAVAQSAAREFGPQGIHVAHVIVDGMIDGDRINTRFPGIKAERPPDALLDPDAIAENYWALHTQPRSAWTHELDLRPWVEHW